MSKSRQRSGRVNFPLPSARFKTIEVLARSNGSRTAIVLGKLLHHRLKPRDERQRFLIHFRFFMVEHAIHSD